MTPQTQFLPASGETATVNVVGSLPNVVTLPAVDSGNPAVMLQNNGPGAVALTWGGTPGGAPLRGALFGDSQALILPPGTARVITDTNCGTFTTATVQAQMGATVTFLRGSVSTVYIFSQAGT